MSTLFDVHADAPRPRAAEGPDALLDGLNPQQREAVLHTGSPLLVVAGAGSGKTKVLTHRIGYLLAARDVHPGQVMAITFTNKAAAEMKERVTALVGPRANAMWVSTFHSMCVRLLRREAKQLRELLDSDMSSSFSIYDADDTRRLVTLVARDLDLDPKRYPARTLAAHVSNHKNELIDPQRAAALAAGDLERRVAEVYAAYQRRLGEANALDFDDLIMRTVQLLQAFPEVAEHYRRRFRHVLVDEYQDTNHAQYVLVRELVGTEADSEVEPSELCVVGDADQSIYAFRGATIRNIVEFERDFPNARTILLEQNYRSTQTILSAANAVIARNPNRRDKRLWTEAGDGHKIIGYVADNEHDEAAFVASEIDKLVDSGECGNGDIAVFYRTNHQSRVFEEIFIRLGLPYRVVGGVRFYERREVRDALAYLRVLANPEDTVSLRRILNVPKRGIGDRAESCVSAHAERERVSFAAALREAAAGRIPELNPRSQRAIAGFVDLVDELRGLVDAGEDVAAVLDAVLDRTGYRAELEASDDPQDGSRLDNLTELVTVAREFTEGAGPVEEAEEAADVPAQDSLAAFLERVSLVADSDSVPEQGEGVVTLMTLHTAKGLEFPVVFCTGWEDGVFPHLRALSEPAELAEERRLAYVGITRARQRLYLSRSLMRSAWGQPVTNPASRFLDEIPHDLLDWRRVESERSGPSAATTWGRRSTGGDSAQAGLAERGMRTTSFRGWRSGGEAAAPALKLEVGDRVNHDKYGLGTVVATEGSGPRATATIDFGSAGTIKLMLIGGVPLVKL
ncbi:DNA helicase PcrA [Gandjariella thermophila]|uniref:ATP-dependent DNA helicase n=1 Tax=Gandjariella thermophila TaxID=1931992 RepID=A0A4D4J266_9PSEU|nr:DNA helicase PcrA [Gandjariella thermophila]GDY29260.1 DNA helicase [Gandjariella thermophila]